MSKNLNFGIFNTEGDKESVSLTFEHVRKHIKGWLSKYDDTSLSITNNINRIICDYITNNCRQFNDIYHIDKTSACDHAINEIYDLINSKYDFKYSRDVFELNKSNILKSLLHYGKKEKVWYELKTSVNAKNKFKILVIRSMYIVKKTDYIYDITMFTNLLDLAALNKHGNSVMSMETYLSCLCIVDMFDLSSEKRFMSNESLLNLIDENYSYSKRIEIYYNLFNTWSRVLCNVIKESKEVNDMRLRYLEAQNGNRTCVIYGIKGIE